MAGCAVADNIHMVKRRLGKGDRAGVTDRTILCGWQVIVGKSSTDHAIVTRGTVVNDTSMIIHASGKGARGMTNTAILCGWHVVDRLASCAIDVRTIVTGPAGLYAKVDAAVIEHAFQCKGAGVMAPAAIVDSDGVGDWFSYRGETIMTAVTATGDDAVVEGGRQKIIRDMTQATVTVGD